MNGLPLDLVSLERSNRDRTAENILLRLRRKIRREVGVYTNISAEQVLTWIAEDLKYLRRNDAYVRKITKIRGLAQGGYIIPMSAKGTTLAKALIKAAKKKNLDVGYI